MPFGAQRTLCGPVGTADNSPAFQRRVREPNGRNSGEINAGSVSQMGEIRGREIRGQKFGKFGDRRDIPQFHGWPTHAGFGSSRASYSRETESELENILAKGRARSCAPRRVRPSRLRRVEGTRRNSGTDVCPRIVPRIVRPGRRSNNTLNDLAILPLFYIDKDAGLEENSSPVSGAKREIPHRRRVPWVRSF